MASNPVMQVAVNCLNGTMAAAGTQFIFGLRAPSAALGGGITILGVDYVSNAAIAAASAPQFQVVKTTAGGSTVNGTIATVLASAAWTAGTSRLGTLSTVFVDAGEYVMVQHNQTAGAENAATPVVTCNIMYTMGR